jgi:aryl-alcohol dehydrogenase-like predicted oxidoreductase
MVTCAFPSIHRPKLCSDVSCREAALERKIDFILAKLRGTKKLDLFEPARLIQGVPLDQSTRIIAKFIAQGKFDHIGLSEVRADHVRQAHSVSERATLSKNISLILFLRDILSLQSKSKLAHGATHRRRKTVGRHLTHR